MKIKIVINDKQFFINREEYRKLKSFRENKEHDFEKRIYEELSKVINKCVNKREDKRK